jgi:hypothetical protein
MAKIEVTINRLLVEPEERIDAAENVYEALH